jgi:N-acylneuraminate cytidylyltransferase
MNVAFVPARCGSQAIKFKNIKLFCGKPLIYWTLSALQNSPSIDIIYIATDCQKIEEVAKSFMFSKVNIFQRDQRNAQHTSPTEDVMVEFLAKQKFNNKDRFLLVQATSPTTQSIDFENALEMMDREKFDSILTVVREKNFFWNDDGTPLNYDYMNRPRRQDFNGLLLENGAFYINSVGNIIKYKNRLSGKIGLYEMEDYSSIDIDEPIDWIIAEKYMKEHVLKNKS